jgi:hypothetical protein
MAKSDGLHHGSARYDGRSGRGGYRVDYTLLIFIATDRDPRRVNEKAWRPMVRFSGGFVARQSDSALLRRTDELVIWLRARDFGDEVWVEKSDFSPNIGLLGRRVRFCSRNTS